MQVYVCDIPNCDEVLDRPMGFATIDVMPSTGGAAGGRAGVGPGGTIVGKLAVCEKSFNHFQAWAKGLLEEGGAKLKKVLG